MYAVLIKDRHRPRAYYVELWLEGDENAFVLYDGPYDSPEAAKTAHTLPWREPDKGTGPDVVAVAEY